MNNIQFVKKMMESGSPLNQVFVIEAIAKYSEQVLSNKESLRQSMKDSLVHPEAWIGCAEHTLKLINERK